MSEAYEVLGDEERRRNYDGFGSSSSDSPGGQDFGSGGGGFRQGCQMAKFDPFLFLGLRQGGGLGGTGWRAWGRNPRKGRDQILLRSEAEQLSRSLKGQTHTILKSGYSHLATLGMDIKGHLPF